MIGLIKELNTDMIDGVKHGNEFRPHAATIKASLVGSYMIVAIFGFLALCALLVLILDQRAGAYLPVSIGLLSLSLIAAMAAAYFPLRRISYRKSLINDIEAGRYFIVVGPSKTTVETKSKKTELAYKDFEFVGKDSLFLGNNRDWGSLVFARKEPLKLTRMQRASIVRPVQKGLIAPETYEGITSVPLVYFTKAQYEEIVTAARTFHAAVR